MLADCNHYTHAGVTCPVCTVEEDCHCGQRHGRRKWLCEVCWAQHEHNKDRITQ